MRRIVLWALSTVTAGVLLFGYRTSLAGPGGTAGPPATAATSQYSAISGTTGTSQSSGASGGSSSVGSGTRTVTGSTAQTRWGPVQVRLALSGSKITKVAVLQYPNANGRDREINSYALPALTKETIDAQSAEIDMVSGATVTSDGYVQSLQSALDRAGL